MVLAHVQGCAGCREEVERLSAAADIVLTLAPDGRTPGRIRDPPVRADGRGPAPACGAAPTAGSGVCGPPPLRPGPGASGWDSASGWADPPPRWPTGTDRGQPDRRPHRQGRGLPGPRRTRGGCSCRCTACTRTGSSPAASSVRGGRSLTVGSFSLSAGSGSWLYQLPVPADQVQAAWVVDGTARSSPVPRSL